MLRPDGPQLDLSLLQDVVKPQIPAQVTYGNCLPHITGETALTCVAPSLSQSSSADPIEKRLSRLKKKLKQVETLKEKQAKGEKLEANQVVHV